MAITFIYPIRVTGQNSINYDTETKVAWMDSAKNDSLDSLNYVMRDKKGTVYELSKEYIERIKPYILIGEDGTITFKTISSFLNCGKNNTYKEWEKIRNTLNQTNGNSGCLQYCIVQNFGEEDIDPLTANEIGVKFAREYLPQYQCVVSTHINTGLIHNHIEFNATSFVDGKKYNRCTNETREIRRISDKICEEYGLQVLDATREMKLVKTQSYDGKTLYYEPTDRKNQIIEGEYADKNDYRNTAQYESIVGTQQSHVEILKNDIDKLIPHSQSYEDLLVQLQNVGYEIKAKTKAGDWRKHISFKLSDWGRYVRDYQLGEEYTREILSENIEKDILGKKNLKTVEPVKYLSDDNIREEELYVYGRIIIEDINEDYRYRKSKYDDGYEKVSRSKVERLVIHDTKKLNSEINLIVKQAIRPQREKDPRLIVENKRKQYLIDRINANLKTLHFVESRELKSFGQINAIVKSLCEKRDACYGQVKLASNALKEANKDLVIIRKYNILKQSIERNSGNDEYRLYEMKNDMDLLKEYESVLKGKNLLEENRQLQFEEKIQKFTNDFKNITASLEKINREIQEYDDCILNISYVDKQGANIYESQIENYFAEKKSHSNSSRKKEDAKKTEDGKSTDDVGARG